MIMARTTPHTVVHMVYPYESITSQSTSVYASRNLQGTSLSVEGGQTNQRIYCGGTRIAVESLQEPKSTRKIRFERRKNRGKTKGKRKDRFSP